MADKINCQCHYNFARKHAKESHWKDDCSQTQNPPKQYFL